MACIALVLSACASTVVEDASNSSGSRVPTPQAVVSIDPVEPTVTPEQVTSDEANTDDGAQNITNAIAVVAERLVPRVIAEFPHNPTNFTQGLLLDADGTMYESTGSFGPSATRLIEIDRTTGETVREVQPTEDVWGEGLALIDDRFVQLTWQARVAYIWDQNTFEKIGEYRYDTAGWGLCYDESEDRLVMSDGSEFLVFRDPDTFAPIGNPVLVLLDGTPLGNINELECVNGRVWANVFLQDVIVEIDAASGAVLTAVDASSLNQPRPFENNAVLNGIAFDPVTEHFLVTGKLWETLYEVEFVAP